MRHLRALFIGLGVGLTFVGCSTLDVEEEKAVVKQEGDRILIVDQSGKEWDVTHAFRKYGMRPSQFQFGLGPYVIRPIVDPEMLSPGDRGYPSGDAPDVVIGTTIGGESRAYRLRNLSPHEVVDDSFGEVHVAVGY